MYIQKRSNFSIAAMCIILGRRNGFGWGGGGGTAIYELYSRLATRQKRVTEKVLVNRYVPL